MLASRYFRCCGTLLLTSIAVWPAQAQPEKAVTTVVKAEPRLLPKAEWSAVEKQIGGLTLVSLRAQKMPAAEALNAVAQQMLPPARTQLDNSRGDPRDAGAQPAEKTLTATYEKQPFWVVMHDAAQKLSRRIDNYDSREDVFSFSQQGMAQPELALASGPCVFTLRDANYTRYLNRLVPDQTAAGGLQARETLVLGGNIYIDPKMRWYPQNLTLHVQEARDEKNQSLLPTEDGEIYPSSPVQNMRPNQMGFNLKPAAQPSKTLKILRGALHGIVATGSQRWEIDDVLHAKAEDLVKTITDGEKEIRFTLKPVTKNGNNLMVKLLAMQNTTAQSEEVRLSMGKTVWLLNTNNAVVSLLDNAGQPLNRSNLTTMTNGTGEMEQSEVDREKTYALDMSFGPDGGFGIGGPRPAPGAGNDGPIKFVLEYQTDWRELIVPFEFKDIPLP